MSGVPAMNAVAEDGLPAPQKLPTPAEVMALVEATSHGTPAVLELCQLYSIAYQGVESGRAEIEAFRSSIGPHRGWGPEHRAWWSERADRALRIVAAFMSVYDSAEGFLDQIYATLPEGAATPWRGNEFVNQGDRRNE